jgi:hypothetical protein
MIKTKLKLKTEYRRKIQYAKKQYSKKSKKSKKYSKNQKSMNGGALGYGVPSYYISAFEKGDNNVAGFFII